MSDITCNTGLDTIYNTGHDTTCNTTCHKCHPQYQRYIKEDKELTSKPISIILTNGQILEPEQNHNTLILSSLHINVLFCKTLIYQSIKVLDISNNPIMWLPNIYTLEKLNCNNCNIQELPNFTNLTELKCSNNNIKQLPNYKKLKHLECSNNYIQELISYDKLTYLQCNNNPITKIDIQSLTYLEATNCPLLIICKIPSLHKRSSVIIHGSIKTLLSKKEYIDTKYTLINWNTNTCADCIYKLFISNDILYPLLPYLFKKQ